MATNQWLGGANPVAQVITLAITGTWSTNDTITLTVGSKSLTYTVLSSDTTNTILAASISTAWNALSQTLYPEFYEVNTSAATGTITFTARTPGVPFTFTKSKSSSGTYVQTTVTANSGPNDYAIATNWSAGNVPTASDNVVFSGSRPDCLYNLDQSAVNPVSVTVLADFTAKIGLPRIHTSITGGASYPEYRTQYLKYSGSSAMAVTIGEGSGTGSGRIKIDTGSIPTTLTVFNSGSPAETQLESILWVGTAASGNTLICQKGTVGVAVLPTETAKLDKITITQRGSVSSDARVRVGSGTTLANVEQGGGTCETLATLSGTLTKRDGTFTLSGTAGITGAVANYKGSLIWRSSGNLGSTVANAGTFDNSQNSNAVTVTGAVSLYKGSTTLDPLKKITWSGGISTVGCGVEDVTVKLGVPVTLGSIS